MEKIIVAIANDHAGTQLKRQLMDAFEHDLAFVNFGTDSEDSVDYPDYVHPLANAVKEGKAKFGILICGSGNGVCITANKHRGIRAALCWNPEISRLARQHNNANVVCIPARYLNFETASQIVKDFLETPFEGGRHANRVDKIQPSVS